MKDENVFVVKFVDDGMRRISKSVGFGVFYVVFEKFAREGIYFGKRCYRFFGKFSILKVKFDSIIWRICKCYVFYWVLIGDYFLKLEFNFRNEYIDKIYIIIFSY